MPGWNIADVLEVVTQRNPEAPAIIFGEHSTTWGELWRRAGGLGIALAAARVGRQANIGMYTRNRPVYIEAFVGCLEAIRYGLHAEGDL